MSKTMTDAPMPKSVRIGGKKDECRAKKVHTPIATICA